MSWLLLAFNLVWLIGLIASSVWLLSSGVVVRICARNYQIKSNFDCSLKFPDKKVYNCCFVGNFCKLQNFQPIFLPKCLYLLISKGLILVQNKNLRVKKPLGANIRQNAKIQWKLLWKCHNSYLPPGMTLLDHQIPMKHFMKNSFHTIAQKHINVSKHLNAMAEKPIYRHLITLTLSLTSEENT